MSVDQMRATAVRHELLKHSFYQRWTRGELTLAELQDYACQYGHVVAAMPRWLGEMAAGSADPTLAAHAREEALHVEMWADFAGALGLERPALAATLPNPATTRLLATGDELVSTGSGAAALWALEVQTPAVSVEKLRGLRDHYGIAGGAGARYFDVHRTLDVRHTAELEAAVEAGPATAATAADAADRMAAALWDLLSSVERAPAEA